MKGDRIVFTLYTFYIWLLNAVIIFASSSFFCPRNGKNSFFGDRTVETLKFSIEQFLQKSQKMAEYPKTIAKNSYQICWLFVFLIRLSDKELYLLLISIKI
jgi:hypothetical protein